MILKKFYSPYLKRPDDVVEIEGSVYRPLFFKLTRGRSDPVHYVCNYVTDEKNVYFVHRTKTDTVPGLKLLKRTAVDEFKAVGWYLGKDTEGVYRGAVRKRSVQNPKRFRQVDQEIPLFFDDECYYDKFLSPLALDVTTFSLIPLTAEQRRRQWEIYNQYLAGRNKPPLPFECSSAYSRYVLDKNALYRILNDRLVEIDKNGVASLLKGSGEEADDSIMEFIEKHPEVRRYGWLR